MTQKKTVNPVQTGVSITLDRPRKLAFDFGALITIEELTGVSLLSSDGWATIGKNLKLSTVAHLLYAALGADDTDNYTKPRTLKLEQLYSLVTPVNLPVIVAAVNEAQRIAFGADTEEKSERPLAEGASPSAD